MQISKHNSVRIAKHIAADESCGVILEIILCAAVRASDGKIVRGYRHVDAIRALQEMPGYENEYPHEHDQGFVTVTNRFVNREEAYRLHFLERNEPSELQSDDL